MIEDLITVADFERVASEKLEPGVLGYFAGGAGDEETLRENVAAWRPLAAAAADAGRARRVGDARASCWAAELSMPLLVAPVAYQRLVDPEGEVAMARAAAEAGTVMCLSTLATTRPRELAEAAPRGRRWFQLYCFRDEGGHPGADGRGDRVGLRGDRRHRRRAAAAATASATGAPASRSPRASGCRACRRRCAPSGR